MSERRVLHRRLRREALETRPGAGRGERLRLRLAGQAPPSFDALARVPMWRLHPAPGLPRVALAAGLLHYRAQIDGELSGARLKPLMEACGEELFDRACATAPPPPDQCAPEGAAIPLPEELMLVGLTLLESVGDPSARALTARALTLVEEAA
ncbi:hypothetical protein [uncultured Sphingomonas sp.]|uniref:hypothetical protein n=1 Tax=uncultured Sphingomonas sp. TaxID=158754 RepID=UPI0035CAAA48